MMTGKNNDEQLRKLFRLAGPIEPSKDFTDNIMQKIGTLSTSNNPLSKSKVFDRYWLVIGLVTLLSIAALIYYFRLSGIDFNPSDIKNPLIPVFTKLFNNIESLFRSFKVSSITIIIILGFSSVFILDKLLNTRRKITHFL